MAHIFFKSTNPTVQCGQTHENHPAKIVLVCAPSALSKMMGSLHPAGALYEKPVNIDRALKSHETFVSQLRRRGIQVRDVRDILLQDIEHSLGDRLALELLAFQCLTYEFESRTNDSTGVEERSDNDPDCGACRRRLTRSSSQMHPSLSDAERYYASDKYKSTVIEEMSHQQLVDIIFTNPTVTISPSERDTGFTACYKFEPLSNIAFVRDQQITTRRGIVMARLKSQQRAKEVDIMRFCFRKLGLSVVGEIPEPGHLEGGDFFPAGEKLCFMGIGPRSDWLAAKYLLENDLFGTEAVAIVKDNLEQKQERMHLDTVFNILSDSCCLMLDEMMGESSPTKRVVDEYVLDTSPLAKSLPVTKELGRYKLRRSDVEFSQYVREQGFSIVSVSGEEQLNYGCNVLNIGNGNIISIEKQVARRIAAAPEFCGTVKLLDFSGVTCMYGGVHCASQVVSRRAPHAMNGSESDSSLHQ